MTDHILEFFIDKHAEQYQGLDDEMPDDCNDWIAGLSDDEVCEMVLSAFRKGI